MSLSSTILGDEVLSIVYPPKVLAEDVVSEGHYSPLPGTHGGEPEVSLVGDVGELRHHEPGAVAVHADAHRLGFFSLFAMFGSPRTVPPLLAILALYTVFGVGAFDTASVTSDIPGRAITDPL